jgi:pimeloyl-ACP methyl ester carboxylesterase
VRLVGRESELAALDVAGRSAVLLLTGEVGVGKTAPLDHAANADVRTRRVSGVAAESEFGFAALQRLLWSLLKHRRRPQRAHGRRPVGGRRVGRRRSTTIDVPTLVIHGDDDQVVPFAVGGKASARRIKDAQLIVYPGAPHGITDPHRERLGRDLLDFVRSLDEEAS